MSKGLIIPPGGSPPRGIRRLPIRPHHPRMCGVNSRSQSIAKLKQAIRTLLKSAVPEALPARPTTAIGWKYAHKIMMPPNQPAPPPSVTSDLPPQITDIAKFKIADSCGQIRAVYAPFVLACLSEVLRRDQLPAETVHADTTLAHLALHWLQAQPPQSVLQLWVARCLSGGNSPRDQELSQHLDELWEKALQQQTTPGIGHLHPLDAETCLDAFVFDELAALHAGFIVALTSPTDRRPARLEQMHTLARYHVENTQPDNTTNQPWGLPAFAYWPDTFPFALQQWHDTQTWLATHPGPLSGLIAGLLADALAYLNAE